MKRIMESRWNLLFLVLAAILVFTGLGAAFDAFRDLDYGAFAQAEPEVLTELFRIFGDSTRVRILYALFEAEMCVCDIAELLGMTQSAISHQLRALKNVRLVRARREGKTVFYSLADTHVRTIIDQGLEHVLE